MEETTDKCRYSTNVGTGRGKGCDMLEIAKRFHDLIQKRIGVAEEFGEIVYGALVVAVLILAMIGIGAILALIFYAIGLPQKSIGPLTGGILFFVWPALGGKWR